MEVEDLAVTVFSGVTLLQYGLVAPQSGARLSSWEHFRHLPRAPCHLVLGPLLLLSRVFLLSFLLLTEYILLEYGCLEAKCFEILHS